YLSKLPSVRPARNPRKAALRAELMSALPNAAKLEFVAVSTTGVSGPPLPVKIACDPKPFRNARKTTSARPFIAEIPRNCPPARPVALALAITFKAPPSPVAIINSFPLTTPALKPTRLAELMTTTSPKLRRSPLALVAIGVSLPLCHFQTLPDSNPVPADSNATAKPLLIAGADPKDE